MFQKSGYSGYVLKDLLLYIEKPPLTGGYKSGYTVVTFQKSGYIFKKIKKPPHL
jgi:hypothetical protein